MALMQVSTLLQKIADAHRFLNQRSGHMHWASHFRLYKDKTILLNMESDNIEDAMEHVGIIETHVIDWAELSSISLSCVECTGIKHLLTRLYSVLINAGLGNNSMVSVRLTVSGWISITPCSTEKLREAFDKREAFDRETWRM